jgi:anti-sigma factor RsiW
MTCREAIEFLASYLDNELEPDVRADFDGHLSICPSCVAYLETYQATIRMAKTAVDDTSETTGAPMPQELIQAILAARRGN